MILRAYFSEKMGGIKEKQFPHSFLLWHKGSPAPVDLLWCWGGAITLHMCNINFNPCTPEGATMQIVYFLYSIFMSNEYAFR